MKKLLLILICLFVSFEVKSLEITFTCVWEKTIYYDENGNISDEKNKTNREFYHIDTDYGYWGEVRGVIDMNHFGDKHPIKFDKNIFRKDFTYGYTTYNRTNGKITTVIKNKIKDLGFNLSESYGNCEEIKQRECDDEKILVCKGKSYGYDKETKKETSYKKNETYFLCKKHNTLTKYPFSKSQKIFADYFFYNDMKFSETTNEYRIYNGYGKDDFHLVILDRTNLEIRDRRNTSDFDDEFVGNCEISKQKL